MRPVLRYCIFLLLGFAFAFSLPAQVITTDPEVPVESASVKIYFHSDRVTGALENYTEDLYTHTGVILKGKEGWQNVIGTWGDNTSQPQLTYLGNYTYELDITPDIHTFYQVAGTDTVVKMAFVFRSADAAKQTEDLFVEVFPEGLNVNILSPDQLTLILEPGDTLHFEVSSTQADSTVLYIDGQRLQSSTGNNLATDYSTTLTGGHTALFTAYGPDGTASDSLWFFVRPPVPVAALPDGITDGINYLSDTSVILSLFAPGKEHVFVLGDFNDWRPVTEGYLNKTPDGNRFWIRIDHLVPGTEYAFQYIVDGEIRIGDPYADKVLDPWNDPWIPIWVYPGLKPYPKEKTEGIVTVLQTGRQPYTWRHPVFTPPPPEKLVIYELLVRDFTAQHTFRSLTDTLDYLVRLGVNAIELMPFSEFEGNSSWGYNPDYYFAPDKYYGPAHDLKAFIDSCHGRGIAVVQDIVLNHAMGQCPLVKLYFDPDAGEWGQPTPDNPWFNVSSPNPSYNWGYDFNHESPYTQAFVTRVTRYWMEEYHVDGFRFDFSKGFTNTPGDGWSYDADRIAILKRYADSIRKARPDALLILEHFTENSEEKELAGYGFLLWGNMNCQYGQASMGYASGPCGSWDFSGVAAQSRGWDTPRLVGYMESHDEERLMYKNITYGNSAGDYNIKDPVTALRRIELNSVFFFTVPGPKMIWQFEELGYDYSIDYNGRTGEKPVRWDYYNDPDRKRLHDVMKALIRLHRDEEIFSNGSVTFSANAEIKTITLAGTSMQAFIIGNFDVTSHTATLTFPAAGTWYGYFRGDTLDLATPEQTFSLAPGEYHLYTTQKLEDPGIPLRLQKISPEIPSFRIWPNPLTRPILNLSFTTPAPRRCTCHLTTLTGTVLFRHDYTLPPGMNTLRIPLDKHLPPGIYLLQVETEGSSHTERIIIPR